MKINNRPVSAYRKYKLKILKRDFCIRISDEERMHAESLQTETQIDQFFISMINKYWR
jgi:hypothetical protein